MIDTVTNGKAGTAMMAYDTWLSAEEIEAVVDFVRSTFIFGEGENTHYHTVANGWPNHERYRIAFPFALGELDYTTPNEALTETQREGKKLFMSSCVTCHERGSGQNEAFDHRAVSFPRAGYDHQKGGHVDSVASASPYHLHDQAPHVDSLTTQELEGERLFQDNCAFCHAADGTGKNWIGSFLQPSPRDLTSDDFAEKASVSFLIAAIQEGVPGTTMPAWRHVLSQAQIEAVAQYVRRVFVLKEM